MNQLQDIKIDVAEPGRLTAQVTVESEHLDEGGWIRSAVLSDLAVASASHGVLLDNQDRKFLRPSESTVRLFQRSEGKKLIAEASMLPASEGPLWRTMVYHCNSRSKANADTLVGEVTQRYEVVQSAALKATAKAEKVVGIEKEILDLAEARAAGNERLSVAEQRRRQIFQGACQVIMKKGYAASTIREIANASGLPVPTMYQYINTKEDILYMITTECMQEIFQDFKANLGQDTGSAEDRMINAVKSYVRYISKNRKYINLVYRETRALSRKNRDRIFDIEMLFTELWERLINYGNETGEFVVENTNLAANMIYFFCNVWSLRYWSIDQYSEEEVQDWLNRFILAGLGKQHS